MSRSGLLTTALLLPLLAGCAATLTLRNERGGPVKNIEVKADGQSYQVAELAPGAEHVRKLKIRDGGDLNVNYTDEAGRANFTSSKEPLKKGDSRKWLLRLNPQTLLSTEIQK